MKLKTGDSVIVIAGKDKGKEGKVTKTLPLTNQVIVDGVNVVTKHQKNRRTRSQGQIIEMEKPVDASNVAILEGGKPVRIGYKIADGKKTRVSKASGKTI